MKKNITISSVNIKKEKKEKSASTHFFNLFYGIIGFLSFFTIILLTKLFSEVEVFIINDLDLILSSLGFILMYGFKELEAKNK
jgi:hypothetical protein